VTMVDLKYIFSEKDVPQRRGVCVYIPTEDGGFVQICDTDVKKVLDQVKQLKLLNEKEKILRLKL